MHALGRELRLDRVIWQMAQTPRDQPQGCDTGPEHAALTTEGDRKCLEQARHWCG